MIVLLVLPCICILEERLPHVALDCLDCSRPRPRDPQYSDDPHLPPPHSTFPYHKRHLLGAWGLFLPGGLVLQG